MNYPGRLRNEKFFGSAYTHVPVEAYPEPFLTIFGAAMDRANANLPHDFRGIAAGSEIAAGLFPLARTGLSLRPVVEAANAFAASLDESQRATLSFELTSEHWRTWHNMHPNLMRHGVCFFDVNEAQRAAGLAIVRETLSAAGFENARGVMKLNEYVAEITGRTEEFGEWYYFMSIFGQPSESEPWGWQLDGHHIIINCFVLGDQMVLTPQFSGSEPVVAESGKYAGTRLFDAEEKTGLDLMKSLSAEQRATATIGSTVPRDITAGAQVDNLELAYAGIRYDALAAAQRELLLKVIDVYVKRIRPGHAEIRMDEVRAHLADTYFAWIGLCDDTSPFYYRIHSPVILIEFDHLPGVVYDNIEPNRRHIHTVVRTPNGNDYGRDLLRQHYAQHDHSHPDTPHRRGHE
jgi:uncharacterized protein DUF3500